MLNVFFLSFLFVTVLQDKKCPPDESGAGAGDLAKISHILTLRDFVVRVDLVNKRMAVWDGWIRVINRPGVVGAVLQLDGVGPIDSIPSTE